jgi:aspartyl-tRNA(Asn)/glutamyl-tRNA(Gln) amidotransferase subunit B
MADQYTPVIGLEVHAELLTRTKMFCGCKVVDTITVEPNSSVCPVCSGMPGALPVINRQAVVHALRVAMALGCKIAPFSLFARKNYFYPDLPKGFQISQYEYPLATGGGLNITTSNGIEFVRLRRIHLEEDTGKLTHCSQEGDRYSLVDLNRAGVGLLEIVTEPVLTSLEAVKAYSTGLRAILRYLKACSGDMEKGAIRFEANISMKPANSQELGTRVEIKNLNSFRAMERAVLYEMERQAGILAGGGRVALETLGWDEDRERTVGQRSKEEAHDYRYFPEPDLPPLTVDEEWLKSIQAGLPELPQAKKTRYIETIKLNEYQADLLCADIDVAEYFEQALQFATSATPQQLANWLIGDVFAYLNQKGLSIVNTRLTPVALVYIVEQVEGGSISRVNGRQVLLEALDKGTPPNQIIQAYGFGLKTEESELWAMVSAIIASVPEEVAAYRAGKVTLLEWFLGQAMRRSQGRVDPNQLRGLIQQLLDEPGQK